MFVSVSFAHIVTYNEICNFTFNLDFDQFMVLVFGLSV
jgi:hypothetical protein